MAGRRKKQNNLTLEEQLEAVEKDIAECKEHMESFQS